MRKLLLAVCVLMLPAVGEAAPCVPDSLTNYIAFGGSGCTIGSNTFANFSAGVTFGTPIDPSQVSVIPSLVSGVGPSLSFALDQSAGPNELLDILIGFQITGASLVGADLPMNGAAATLDGVVTAVEDVCVGGTFAPFPVCSGSPQSLIAVQDGIGFVPALPVSFAANSFFDVFVDIAVDGGVSGTASLVGNVATQFVQQAVPEPAATLLVGFGLFGLVARRHRARVAKRSER